MKLYIKELKDKDRPESIIKFLKLFLFETSSTGDLYSNAKATYSNKTYLRKQCPSDRMRSFDDILSVTSTYYPSITPKKLFHILLTTNFKANFPIYNYNTSRQEYVPAILKLQMSNCSTMRKIRATYINGDLGYNYNVLIHIDHMRSKYSWKDLLDMLNIKSQEDLDAYLVKYTKVIE